MTLNGSQAFLKHLGSTGKQLTFLSGQKCSKSSIIKRLKNMEISSFDDYYDIATTLDKLIDTCDFTMDEWMELFDINEKVIEYERERDNQGIES